MEQIKLKYEKNDFLRIDKYLNEIFEEFTRTQLQLMIEDGLVTVNDKVIKSNYKLKINDLYSDKLSMNKLSMSKKIKL